MTRRKTSEDRYGEIHHDCINTFIEEQPDEKLRPSMTPAANYLFKTCDGLVDTISKQRTALFHASVAKLLLISKEQGWVYCWQYLS
jgi:hypothetical protein